MCLHIKALKFSCENCGLRYSDQSTLNTHKQNYCSKRNQLSSRSSSSSSSSSIGSPESSRSNSPRHPQFNTNTNQILDGQQFSENTKLKHLTQENNMNSRSNSSERSTSSDHSSNSSSGGGSDEEETKLARVAASTISQNKQPKAKTTAELLQCITSQSNGVQLLKSVAYQCNYCLFQTDKKTAMNKHSRVHLPQKRKEMEELAQSLSQSPTQQHQSAFSTFASKTSLLGQPDLSSFKESDTLKTEAQAVSTSELSNDKTQSYCADCDIQFSSMKTFLHHRNNYCQKFKTIESIVPVEVATSNAVDKSAKVSTLEKLAATPKLTGIPSGKNAASAENYLKRKHSNKPADPITGLGNSNSSNIVNVFVLAMKFNVFH